MLGCAPASCCSRSWRVHATCSRARRARRRPTRRRASATTASRADPSAGARRRSGGAAHLLGAACAWLVQGDRRSRSHDLLGWEQAITLAERVLHVLVTSDGADRRACRRFSYQLSLHAAHRRCTFFDHKLLGPGTDFSVTLMIGRHRPSISPQRRPSARRRATCALSCDCAPSTTSATISSSPASATATRRRATRRATRSTRSTLDAVGSAASAAAVRLRSPAPASACAASATGSRIGDEIRPSTRSTACATRRRACASQHASTSELRCPASTNGTQFLRVDAGCAVDTRDYRFRPVVGRAGRASGATTRTASATIASSYFRVHGSASGGDRSVAAQPRAHAARGRRRVSPPAASCRCRSPSWWCSAARDDLRGVRWGAFATSRSLLVQRRVSLADLDVDGRVAVRRLRRRVRPALVRASRSARAGAATWASALRLRTLGSRFYLRMQVALSPASTACSSSRRHGGALMRLTRLRDW